MGIYIKEQKSYLVFAENVTKVPFTMQKADVFKIETIKVYSLSSYNF